MRGLAAALWLLAAPAAADPAALAADAAARMATAAEALSQGDTLAGAALAIEAYEDAAAALRESLRGIEIRRADLARARIAGDATLAAGTRALLRVARLPRESLALHPQGALAAARAARLTATASARLSDEVATLAALETEAEDMGALRRAVLAELSRAVTGARAARRRMLGAAEAAEDAPTDAGVIAALVETADTVAALADALAAETEDVAGSPEILALPVAGAISRDGDGFRIAAPPGRPLRAPARATVRYVGPAPGRPGESALILETAPGQLVVLAARMDPVVARGAILRAGQPVAVLRADVTDNDPFVNESALASGQDLTESLYIEVRQGTAAADAREAFGLPENEG